LAEPQLNKKYKPHRDVFTEENELLLRFETNRPSADSTAIFTRKDQKRFTK